MNFGDIFKNVAEKTLEYGEKGAKEVAKAGQAGYEKIEETVERAKENKQLQEETKKIVTDTDRNWQDAVSRLEVAVEDTQEALEALDKQRIHIIEYQGARFQRLYEYSLQLEEFSATANLSLESTNKNFANVQIGEHVYGNQINPAVGGAAAGAAAAATAVGATAFFGTAGTGTAIASLHGAAAINATLASLGGGSLAAGGLGMAGGMAVLGGLLIIPGIAVGGYFWDKNVRQSYQKAVDYSEQVKESILKLKDIQGKYKRVSKTIQATIYETTALNGFLDGLLNVFESDIITGTSAESRKLCVDALTVSKRLLCLNFVTQGKDENTTADKELLIIHDDLDWVKREFGIYLSGLSAQYRKDAKHQVDEAVKKFHDNMDKQYTIKPLENEELRDVLLQTFELAQKEICIITPWITRWVVDGFMIDKMRQAIEKGVKIRILYGIGDISSTQQKKSNYNDNDRNIKTENMAQTLQKTFAKYGNRFSMHRSNTHGKLLICDDQFYVIGSFNFLSFDGDYTKDNVRGEIGDFSENKEMITFYKKRFFSF